LFVTEVSGRNLVPKPPASTTPFNVVLQMGFT
jgi:hypothetical protein